MDTPIKIKARKIFYKPKQGEYAFAIISYRLMVWSTRSYDAIGMFQRIESFKHALTLDLWIVKLYFVWYTKGATDIEGKFIEPYIPDIPGDYA